MNEKAKSRFYIISGIAIIFLIASVLAVAINIPVTFPNKIVPYHALGNNLQVNFSIGGDNLRTCYYEYNRVNTSIACGFNNFTTYNHSYNILDFFASTSAAYGWIIKVNVTDMTVYGFNNISALDNSTRGQIRSTAEVNISTCAVSNNQCNFPGGVQLSANTTYYFVTDGNGSSVGRYRNDTGGGSPYNITLPYFQIIGAYTAGSHNPNDVYTIRSVNVSNYVTSSNISINLNLTSYENRTIIFYASNTSGTSRVNITTWNYSVFELSRSGNSSVFETESQTYSININYSSAAYSSISADLYFNNQRFSSSKSGSGDYARFDSTLEIPVSTSQQNYSWAFFVTNSSGTKNVNSSSSSVTVNSVNLTICGSAPLNVPFLNFTFKNETASQESLNSVTIPSATFTYWMGDQNSNRTFSYSSLVGSPSYAFCFSPASQQVNVLASISYDNDESTQRTRTITTATYTNLTTNIVLYLLPDTLAAIRGYVTVNSIGSPIGQVFGTVTKELGASTVTISSGYTDDSGSISFILNPSDRYCYSWSKSGFQNNEFCLTPSSSDTYTVTMGSSGTGTYNGTQAGFNLTYSFVPSNDSLINNTVYDFGINVSGSSVSYVEFNLTNTSGHQVLFTTSNAEGLVSGSYDTGNETRLVGRVIITNNGENITISNVWIVGDFYEGDYSFKRQFELFMTYEFAVWPRILIILLIVISLTLFLSYNEIIDTAENKILAITLLIWIFSLVGWLDIGITTNTSGNLAALTQHSSKYGIAYLMSAIAFIFTFKRFMFR